MNVVMLNWLRLVCSLFLAAGPEIVVLAALVCLQLQKARRSGIIPITAVRRD